MTQRVLQQNTLIHPGPFYVLDERGEPTAIYDVEQGEAGWYGPDYGNADRLPSGLVDHMGDDVFTAYEVTSHPGYPVVQAGGLSYVRRAGVAEDSQPAPQPGPDDVGKVRGRGRRPAATNEDGTVDL